MRDFRFSRLERHKTRGTRDRMELSYSVPRSPSGKVYQLSPSADAVPRLFLIGDAPEDREVDESNRARTRRDPGPGETVCPYSGHIAPDEEFIHFSDIEAIKTQIEWEAAADVEDYLADMARDFNRRQTRGGLISISMDVKPKHRPRPLTIRQDLLRDLDCNICARSYGVYAIALFCPDCGAPNLSLHFSREVMLIREQVELADAQAEAGKSEFAYRLMGNAHEDVLTAFETTLKTIYRHLVSEHLAEKTSELCSSKSIGNAFQNVDRASEKFSILGIDPFTVLAPDELAVLDLNIQKRHVIGHNLGIVDDRYLELTQREQPGETVALIGNEIGHFAKICAKVVADLERWLLPDAKIIQQANPALTSHRSEQDT